jgi:hypothetical protein
MPGVSLSGAPQPQGQPQQPPSGPAARTGRPRIGGYVKPATPTPFKTPGMGWLGNAGKPAQASLAGYLDGTAQASLAGHMGGTGPSPELQKPALLNPSSPREALGTYISGGGAPVRGGINARGMGIRPPGVMRPVGIQR